MRPDGEDEGRLAEADEAPAADSIVYSLSRAVNWGSWQPEPQLEPPAAPIAALAAPASALEALPLLPRKPRNKVHCT